jgi:hypothetical protein
MRISQCECIFQIIRNEKSAFTMRIAMRMAAMNIILIRVSTASFFYEENSLAISLDLIIVYSNKLLDLDFD